MKIAAIVIVLFVPSLALAENNTLPGSFDVDIPKPSWFTGDAAPLECMIEISSVGNPRVCIKPNGDVEVKDGTISEAAKAFYAALQPYLIRYCVAPATP